MGNTNIFYSFNEKNNFTNMKDEELITLIKLGNQEALDFIIHKYKELVNMKVSKYYIIGAEKEDIIQEGMIGLYKAIKGFEQDKQNSFKTFANLCIERQLITAIKTSNRQKHIPLNSYLSLNTSAYEDDNEASLIDIFDSHTIEDPLDTIANKEYLSQMEAKIDESLSSFEKKVFVHYKQGKSYNDIAKEMNTKVKSIDTALQRIKKKVNKIKNQVDGKQEV